MDFLKRLFGGGGSSWSGSSTRAGDPNGLYFYVQPDGCDEIVRVRIDRNNDLSLSDSGDSYIIHKNVRGVKCRQNVDLTLTFDSSRRLRESEVTHGTLVAAAAYEAWAASSSEG